MVNHTVGSSSDLLFVLGKLARMTKISLPSKKDDNAKDYLIYQQWHMGQMN